MPYSYYVDEKDDLARITVTGQFTLSELTQLRAQLLSDPLFNPSMNQLIDISGGEGDVGTEVLRSLAESDIPRSGGKVAFVVGTGPRASFLFGRMRQYQAFRNASPEKIEVFRDLAEAGEWLSR